jgi:hypothetical protein
MSPRSRLAALTLAISIGIVACVAKVEVLRFCLSGFENETEGAVLCLPKSIIAGATNCNKISFAAQDRRVDIATTELNRSIITTAKPRRWIYYLRNAFRFIAKAPIY